jgi:hypothetical protein
MPRPVMSVWAFSMQSDVTSRNVSRGVYFYTYLIIHGKARAMSALPKFRHHKTTAGCDKQYGPFVMSKYATDIVPPWLQILNIQSSLSYTQLLKFANNPNLLILHIHSFVTYVTLFIA